jgi:hypothetical protein
MTWPRLLGLALGASVVGLCAADVSAEPMFLARQYARCTACHYSATGGGMLTPYGRSLSRQELSTTGQSDPNSQAQGKEQEFLWGLLHSKPEHLDLSIDLRPSRVHVDAAGQGTNRDFFMTADILAAYRVRGWTLYGELGREPLHDGAKIDTYEHWVAYQSEKGLGFRVGRFLPAYGIRLADHTAFTRRQLGLDMYDQLYALELSLAGRHSQAQVSLSPGRAESIIHNDGLRAFTATGRLQLDLSPRAALVVSGLYRGASRFLGRNGTGGVAFGFSPVRRLSVWTQADVLSQQGVPGAASYTLLNETSLEVYRGLWLKFSPQLRTGLGNTSSGTFRTEFAADLYPRTHWNVGLSYYRDEDRLSHASSKTLLAQLHLYL